MLKMENNETGFCCNRFVARCDRFGFSCNSFNLLLRWSRCDRGSWNEWCPCCRKACTLSTVLYYRIGRAVGFWFLAGLSSPGRMHRKNMHNDKREDHTRAPLDRCLGHWSSDLTSELRGRLDMKGPASKSTILLLLGVTACNRLGTKRSYAVVEKLFSTALTLF